MNEMNVNTEAKAKLVTKKNVTSSRAKKLKAKKLVTTTKLKSVTVELNSYKLTATQENTVKGKGKDKTVSADSFRFALTDSKGNLVATTGNKKLASLVKLNKKNLKSVAPSVLPIVKKMIKSGELNF